MNGSDGDNNPLVSTIEPVFASAHVVDNKMLAQQPIRFPILEAKWIWIESTGRLGWTNHRYRFETRFTANDETDASLTLCAIGYVTEIHCNGCIIDACPACVGDVGTLSLGRLAQGTNVIQIDVTRISSVVAFKAYVHPTNSHMSVIALSNETWRWFAYFGSAVPDQLPGWKTFGHVRLVESRGSNNEWRVPETGQQVLALLNVRRSMIEEAAVEQEVGPLYEGVDYNQGWFFLDMEKPFSAIVLCVFAQCITAQLPCSVHVSAYSLEEGVVIDGKIFALYQTKWTPLRFVFTARAMGRVVLMIRNVTVNSCALIAGTTLTLRIQDL